MVYKRKKKRENKRTETWYFCSPKAYSRLLKINRELTIIVHSHIQEEGNHPHFCFHIRNLYFGAWKDKVIHSDGQTIYIYSQYLCNCYLLISDVHVEVVFACAETMHIIDCKIKLEVYKIATNLFFSTPVSALYGFIL